MTEFERMEQFAKGYLELKEQEKRMEKSLIYQTVKSYNITEDKILVTLKQKDIGYKEIVTKLVIPSLEDIALNKPPINVVEVDNRGNKKIIMDFRVFFEALKKNPNLIKSLFINTYEINSFYKNEWEEVLENREAIAYYHPLSVLQAAKKDALSEYEVLMNDKTYNLGGYSKSSLYRLLKIAEFMENYKDNKSYEDCLTPAQPQHLNAIRIGNYDEIGAYTQADRAKFKIQTLMEDVIPHSKYDIKNYEVETFLKKIQIKILEKSFKLGQLK